MNKEKVLVFHDTTKIPREYFAGNPDKLTGDVHHEMKLLRFELVPRVGALTYVAGAEYPRKGLPAVDVLYAVNILKEVIKQTFKFPIIFLFGKLKPIIAFNSIAKKILEPYHFNHLYMCHTARMTWFGISRFLKEVGVPSSIANNTGFYLSHVVEADDGYRHREEDIFTEVNWLQMKKDPIKESNRVLEIYRQRESVHVYQKTIKFIKPAIWLLYIPKYRKAFIRSIEFLEQIRYDKSDMYWVKFKPDKEYKYGGKSHTEWMMENPNIKIPEMYIRL